MAGLTFDTALQTILQHPDSPSDPAVSEAIVFLGELSSKERTHREALASTSILEGLLKLLHASLNAPEPLQTAEPTLRCIGNAIILSDEGRQIVTDHGFQWASVCLLGPENSKFDNTSLSRMAFKCLYNICRDYPSAMKRCLAEHIHEDIRLWYFEVVTDDKAEHFDDDLVSMICDLLLSIEDLRDEGFEPDEVALRDARSRRCLLDMPLKVLERGCTIEDFATCVDIALGHLRDEGEQIRFVEEGQVSGAWQLLEAVEQTAGKESQAGNDEEVKLLLPLSTSLTWCLSDMAALPEFAKSHASGFDQGHTRPLDTIRAFGQDGVVASGTHRMISAACQVLGNLVWSLQDLELATPHLDLMDSQLHSGLLRSVASSDDADTLHSLTGLLLQMCRYSPEYRCKLASDEQLRAVLEKTCRHTSKEIANDGLKLLQFLGRDDFSIREKYTGFAREIEASRFPEDVPSAQAASQQGGSVVEMPD